MKGINVQFGLFFSSVWFCFFKTVFVLLLSSYLKKKKYTLTVYISGVSKILLIVCISDIIFGITAKRGESLLVSLTVFSNESIQFNKLYIIQKFCFP